MCRINWKEQFDNADKELLEMHKEKRISQLKELAIKLILDMDEEKGLHNITTFIACYNNKRLAFFTEGWKIVEKGGASCEEN